MTKNIPISDELYKRIHAAITKGCVHETTVELVEAALENELHWIEEEQEWVDEQ